MRSLSSSVSFKYAWRFTLLSLLAACALLRPLPPSVHSSSLPPTQQSFGPESNTGTLSTAREGHTATLLQNGKVLVAGGRNGGGIYNTAEVYDPVTATWAATANTLTNARYGHSAVLLRNGQVLVIGGQGSNGFLDSAEIYDPSDNLWKSALLSHMNATRFHTTATLLANGRVLVAGGQNASGYLRNTELYNPVTRVWTRLDLPNNPAGNLTEVRAEHTATLLNDGRVLVTGGFNGSAALKTVEIFEPSTNRWHRVADLTSPRRLHTATLLPDGTVLAAGGLNGSTALGNSESYSPATGVWTLSTSGLTARRSHTTTLLPNGNVLVVGGKNSAGTSINSAELYSTQARSWSNALLPYTGASFALNNARSDHTATLLVNGQVLFAGGLDGSNSATVSVELYEYAAAAWSLTKNAAGATTRLGLARADHTATLLPNGKVLVAGGYALSTSVTTLNSCELYDPASGIWTPTGSLNVARAVHTATLLANGKVLVVGGQLLNPNGSAAGLLSSAELYDPITGQWTLAADSDVPSRRHTATLLPNGRVLVVGGVGTDGRSNTRVQLYDPATDTWSNAAALSPARSFHSATLLPTGEVFIFGGMDSTNAILRTGAIFNATSGSWTLLTFTNPTPAFRYLHKATLLPNGKIFISGGIGGTNTSNLNNALGLAEIYNISTRRFEAGGVTIGSRAEHTATLLPNGKVLIVGGYTLNNVNPNNCGAPPSAPQALLYDPTLSAVNELYDSFAPLQGRNGNGRDGHTATLLANGKVLIAGGVAGEMLPQCLDQAPSLLSQTELYDPGLGFNDNWRPTITHFSTPVAGSITELDNLAAPDQSAIVVNGVQFQGISEASGHGAASSASNYPVAQLHSLLNEQLAIVPVNSASGGWTNNTFAYITPASFPAGPALLTIFANGIPSVARVVAAPGGDLVPPNASPTGTISGRVILHNGTGLAAAVTLTPTAGSPSGCSGQRTLTTGPNGEFTFQDVVVSPRPIIDCAGNRNLACTNSTANGCTVTYTTPTASPAGTAVTCAPGSGVFFPLGTTTVTCTANNAAGSSTCRFPVTIVPFTLTCPQNQTANIPSGNGANISYSNPLPSPINGTTVSCKPLSGSFFPVGTTTVNCTASNPSTTAVATCSFSVTVRVQGLSLNCPSDRTVQVSSDANGAVVTYPAPTASIAGAPTSCSPPSGSFFPVGTTVVTCTASTGGATASCRFNVTVQKPVFSEKQPRSKTAELSPAQPTAFALIPLAISDNEPAKTLTAPEQNQTNCRYQVQPAATVGTQPVGFFPATAIFNMIEAGVVSFASTNRAQLNLSAPEQTGGQTCQYCTGNKFVSETPYWNIAGRIQKPNGMGVTDVDLEFSVPYETCDDRLTCQDGAGYPISCKTPGANTINGDLCAKASTNLLDPAAEYHCACTTLRSDGTCEKTVLARYPGIPALRAPFDSQAGFDWRNQLFQIQPNGSFNIANVPNGANAVVTPSNRPGGTQYTFSYQPALPAGLLPQNYLQLDQITRSYDNQIITAEAACTAPAITAQPANQTVCAGAAATFSVAASGAGLGYQWRKGGVNIASATASSYTIAAVTASDAASYDVVVSSSCGAVMSATATLTVNNATAIIMQPVNQTACASTSATFSVVAAGTGLAYQWRKGGVNISGATGSTYSIPSVVAAIADNYDVIITGMCGSVTSAAATLTVNAATVITTQPANQAVCPGSSATFAVGAAGTGLNYQWRKGGVNIPGATGSSYTLPVVDVGDAGIYDVLVSGACGNLTSTAATLTINAATTISTQPANQAVCPGGSASFSVAAAGAGILSYQWRKNGVALSGATNSSFNINGVTAADAGNYDVAITGGCGTVTSNVATLTINALPELPAINAPASVCANSTNNQASGPAGASGYEWTISNGTITSGATAQTVNYTAGATGNVTLTLRVTNTATCAASNVLSISINSAPTVAAQPADQTVCDNSAATFTAAANNTATVQWQLSTDGGANFTNVPGANNTTLNFTTSAGQNGARYRAVFTNSCGTATTNSAILTVSPLLGINTQPASHTICAGSPVSFNVSATGANLSYQWRRGGVAINSATGNSYTINSVTVADAGSYDVVVTSTCGILTSSAASLSVNPATAITAQPTNQVSCLDGAVSFSVAATGANLSYQWRKNGANINGATNSSFAINPVAAGDAGSYDIVVTGACGVVTSQSVTLGVNAETSINTQPANQAACPGESATFSVAASGAGTLGYQWRKGGMNIPGATGSSFTINPVTASDVGSYDVVVTSSCGVTTSNAATLTINAATTLSVQPQPQTVCLGAPASFSVSATGTNLSYQWRKKGANIAGATASTYSLATTTAADADNYDVVVTGTCGTVSSNPVTLSVNNTTAITAQPTNQTVCTGNNTTFSVTASGIGLTYQWRKDGVALIGATSSSYNINVTALSDVGNYEVVITGVCGAVTSNSASLTVNAATAISAQPADQTVCTGSNVTFNVGATGTNLSYQWRKGGVVINGATSNSYTINAAAGEAGNYDAVVTGACGVVTSNPATLIVNPATVISAQPANQAACLGSPVTFTISATGTSLAYQWRKGGVPVNGATSSSFTMASVAAGDAGSYEVVVTGACGTLISNAATLTLNPATEISIQPINQAVCVGGSATFSVAASGTGTLSYQWRKGGAALNGATGNSFTINSVAAGDAGNYDVIVTGGCGTMTSSAATLTVNAFALSASNAAFQATASTGAVDLTATVGQCTWNAVSNDNWITVTSVTSVSGTAPSSGTGNGRVNYSVAANSAPSARTGTLSIAGLAFTVTQSGSAPTPRLDVLSLTSALAGSSGFTLTVTGANFTNSAAVRWQGSARATTFVSNTQLTAQITAADLATAGSFTVDVFDPPPGGGASNALSFTVIQPNPAPQISSLNPSTREAGSGQFTLTVNGGGFFNGSVVRWNNSDRMTTFVSATQLTAIILATDSANAGTATVTVFNLAPGGGTSNGLSFTINQAPPLVPTLTSLNPTSVAAGGEQFTLTVNGTNFVNTSDVRWNGTARSTTFVSATQLTATIPASDIIQPGTAQVTVFTPANSGGGGGESSALSFTIQPAPPPPAFVAMSPNAAVVGGQDFTLTINGSGFSSGTVVRWNGNDRPTKVVSSTQVTAAIPASDIAQPGINQVTIFTPPPGGGSATAITFVVGAQATNVSAASFERDRSAAEAITSVFGAELATALLSATTLPLPTTLAGTTVKVRDSLGTERAAPLFFVSPGQINYLVPPGTATGAATAIITSGNNKISVAALDVQTIAPALFTANSSGQGAPSGLLLRVNSSGQQSFEPLSQLQAGSPIPRPLDLGPEGDRVFLVLFGTGMRGLTSLVNASATLGGVNLPLLFLGAQGDLIGVDQVNLGPLPRSLAGRGNVNLVLTVGGRAANTVQLNIQ
jgi:uncharacterized protein (TIGR03437 family)